MTSYVDETGIYLDTFAEIKDSLIADLKEIFGEGINTDNAARLGQLINIISERVADQNELIQLVANSQDPTSAIGVWLEQIVRINGITKNEAEYSTVPLEITATAAGCTILAGDTFEVAATGEKFAIDTDTTIAPSGSEIVTATAINPGAIEMSSTVTTADDSLLVNNPRYGFSVASPTADASLGALEETDQALRIRRDLAASKTGSSSVAAIFQKLADMDEVAEAKVYQNVDGSADSLGVPGHSVWCIVNGGSEADVAQAIFENLGAGVGMYGDNTYAYADPITGETWDVTWSYGSEVQIYINVRTKKITGYPGDGDALIKQNIVDFFNGDFTLNGQAVSAFGLGVDVANGRLFTPANVVPGHQIEDILISTSPTPSSGATISIDPDEYAGTEIANIVITNIA